GGAGGRGGGGAPEPLARAPAPKSATGEVALTLPKESLDKESKDASGTPLALVARLTGADAIASDDVAIVVSEAGPSSVAVVADTPDEAAATGGAPIVEQALPALPLDGAGRPV